MAYCSGLALPCILETVIGLEKSTVAMFPVFLTGATFVYVNVLGDAKEV